MSVLSWVTTADQINSIKPDQAVGYWSGSVRMSGRGWSGRSALVGLPTRYFLTCQKISSSSRRSGSEDRVDRESIVHLDSPEIGKMRSRIELGRVWSGQFGDRDDRVDRIGSGNPPSSTVY
ncbi:hypothetical protein DPMN_050887 [Dreissena polymorpha]|uniref:Uncharacterized protein n=1 Tax=Dreissena polymorpha TaxID=45954 RepID=A0A9D4CGY5_DREPO|nr:hypothetical protein DPMN_050887 [Dreissena polymorpha]